MKFGDDAQFGDSWGLFPETASPECTIRYRVGHPHNVHERIKFACSGQPLPVPISCRRTEKSSSGLSRTCEALELRYSLNTQRKPASSNRVVFEPRRNYSLHSMPKAVVWADLSVYPYVQSEATTQISRAQATAQGPQQRRQSPIHIE